MGYLGVLVIGAIGGFAACFYLIRNNYLKVHKN
jgi:hypothetical protein